uniref:Retrotransposon protein putative n=1 Tax=Albugo laibachii Nc14 TaxID=890382 RepID=F0WLL3_9STRA|nr:retrotransposon protein putative [Albugo laibachii Nc14]|eukprot:CCA22178.1 retrotransposon protein putative [Albugo laibachii Nc14]
MELQPKARTVKKVVATIVFDQYRFRDSQVMEWPLGSTHDVIFGNPWFTNFQPHLNWRSHEITFRMTCASAITSGENSMEIAAVDLHAKSKQTNSQTVFRGYHSLASTNSLIGCAIVLSFQFWTWIKATIKCGVHSKVASIPPFEHMLKPINSVWALWNWGYAWCVVSSHASFFAKYKFIVVDWDEICVLSTSMDAHVEHLRIPFEGLRNEKLFCHQSKCRFGQSEVKFLGHTTSAKGLTVNTRKTEAIAKRPIPVNQRQLLSLLGLLDPPPYRKLFLLHPHVLYTWGGWCSNDCTNAALQLKHGDGHVQLGPLRDFNAFEPGSVAMNEFANGYRNCPDFTKNVKHPDGLYIKHNGVLFSNSQTMIRLCVPHTKDNDPRTSIIACFHDSNTTAHPGAQRMLLRIAQWYHWPTLNQDVLDYVQSCETCSRWKHSNARKNGKMIPIPIPGECWLLFSMDFITGLPNSNRFDAIMTAVDKLPKRPKYRARNRTDDAQTAAFHFFDCVVRRHGLPSIIISD